MTRRQTRHSTQLKLQLARAHLYGESSYKAIAKENDISHALLMTWTRCWGLVIIAGGRYVIVKKPKAILPRSVDSNRDLHRSLTLDFDCPQVVFIDKVGVRFAAKISVDFACLNGGDARKIFVNVLRHPLLSGILFLI